MRHPSTPIHGVTLTRPLFLAKSVGTGMSHFSGLSSILLYQIFFKFADEITQIRLRS